MGSETHVGRLLREAREGRFKGRRTGLRQIEARIGISRPTLNHWETGHTKTIPIAQAMALAVELEIPLQELRAAALADATELRGAQPVAPGSENPEARPDAMADGTAMLERPRARQRKPRSRVDEEQG